MTAIRTVEDVLEIFEMADQIQRNGACGSALTIDAYNDLCRLDNGERSGLRIWSDACQEYDRRHMSEADYRDNDGCDE